jgi:hypothetical protein
MIPHFILCLGAVAGQVGQIPTEPFANPRHTAIAALQQTGAPARTPRLPGASTTSPATNSEASQQSSSSQGNAAPTEKEPHSGENGFHDFLKPKRETGGFLYRIYKAYWDEFFPSPNQEEPSEPARRAMPSPWDAPPFPGSEYQGYPLLGVPAPDAGAYPVMKAIYGANTDLTEWIKNSRISFMGWVTSAGTWSTAKNSNVPASYWIVPNRYELDQLVFKLERYPDTVQTDHIDWGFRIISLYGLDYRYTTAGGWFSDQLLEHNLLYGWDPTEVYFNVYIPGFLGGTDIRVGRWIACPDIETQYSVDNYFGSHSLLFTVDTYTNTGIMLTQKLNEQWNVQLVVHSGTDMAPWYKGSVLTGAAGVRWVSPENNDAVYAWLNAINSAEFRHFQQYGQPLGHDNFNYFVATWEHRFNKDIHTKTEAYYMWERNAEIGGTPSAGPVKPFGGGGGDGTLIPGFTQSYGVLNCTMFAFTKKDYVGLRNEWYKDESGYRLGTRGAYTSHAINLSHYFNDVLIVRPEIGYYRNWENPAFDNGTRHGIWIYGFDLTFRF